MKRWSSFQRKCAPMLCGVLSGISVLSASVCVCAADMDQAVDEVTAQEIALEDSGIQEADAQRLRTKYEREDGEDVIEVEFSCDGIGYEYMIRTWDGMILEWSIDGRDVGSASAELYLAEKGADTQSGSGDGVQPGDTQSGAEEPGHEHTHHTHHTHHTQSGAEESGLESADSTRSDTGARIAADGTELIGIEAAKEAVLSDSGFAPENAEFTKLKFEFDGRFYVYEIEVREGHSEYEYTLDAQTGDITEFERD